MRLNLQHLNVRSFESIDTWVEKQILALGAIRQIDEANIRLVRLTDSSPAYQVHAHLVTPGPDVYAEARDHTLRAAFSKALTQLREQINSRATARLQKMKNKIKAPRTV